MLCALPGAAQPSAEDDPPQDPIGENLRQFQDLLGDFRKLGDWDTQAEQIGDTVERYWEENDWHSEADEFAKRTALEIAGIPPWDITGRMGKMSDLMSERYGFADEQRRRFESSTYSEMGWFLVKNSKVLLSQTEQFLEMHSAGEPFTADMIARQTRESEPLLADMRERVDRMVKSLEKTMTPQQRAILKRDLDSLQRRQKFYDRLRRRWAEGKWEPRDWGLEKDPTYANWHENERQRRLQEQQAALESARQRRESIRAVDETRWERYVREFVRKYKLDDAQSRTAYSILRELQARAADYKKTHREEIARLARHELASHPLGEPLKNMFRELKTRLEPIPTAAQHEAAGPRAD